MIKFSRNPITAPNFAMPDSVGDGSSISRRATCDRAVYSRSDRTALARGTSSRSLYVHLRRFSIRGRRRIHRARAALIESYVGLLDI